MSEPSTMSPHDTPRTPSPSSHGARRGVTVQDLTHLDFAEEVLLPEARSRGVLTMASEAILSAVISDLRLEASAGVRPHPLATGEPLPGELGPLVPGRLPGLLPPFLAPAPAPSAARPWAGPGVLPPPEPVLPPVRAPRPSPLRQWWGRTLEAVGSDLAVHGLAYLGVLLFFVGAFGLVAFAFGDVARELRPVAEAVIAAAPFAAGALLRRRRAEFVGRALEIAGGLVLPIMLVTTFLDGVELPPDLSGVPLVVALTVLLAVVAGGYAAWSVRVPDSGLRFLVAPVAWLAVAMATMGIGRAIPEGKAVATPSAAQTAAMALAVLVTLGWARVRPRAPLAEASRTAAVPGLVVVGSLVVLTWAAEGAPVGAVLVAGVAVLGSIELLAPRLPAVVPGAAEPLWWLTVWAALLLGLAAEPAAVLDPDSTLVLGPDTPAVAAVSVLAAAGFIAILERAGAQRRRPAPALLLPSIGLVLTLVATWVEPGWAAAALAGASGWAAMRRIRPYRAAPARVWLDVATAVLPVGAVLALVAATDPAVGAAGGAALVLLAAVPARRGWLDRPDRRGDGYWPLWWSVGTALVALLAVESWLWAPDPRGPWLVALAFAFLAMGAAIGPATNEWRVPAVTSLTALAWLAASSAVGAGDDVRYAVLGAAGLGLVVLAHRPNRPRWSGPAASIGVTGHLLGVLAVLPVLGAPWGGVATAATATVAWSLTSWFDATDRSDLGAALRSADERAGWLPYALALAGLPLTVSLALDRSGLLLWTDTWAPAVVTGAALAYALVPRTGCPERVAVATAWGGFAVGLVATALAVANLPAAVAWGAIALVVAVLPPVRRHPVMTWVAWAAPVPTAFLLGRELWPWFAAQPVGVAAALASVSVGVLLVVGAATADVIGQPWQLRARPTHPWARAPLGIGAVSTGAGLAVALASGSQPVAGWLLVTVGLALLAVAALFRAGVLAGVAVAAAWWGVLLLARPALEARPWIAVAVVLALLVIGHLFSMRASGPWWSRWGWPAAVASAPIAVSGLVLAGSGRPASPVYVALGIAGIAAGVRLRLLPAALLPLLAVGSALGLVGAGWAGVGWLALALLGLAATLSTLGAVISGPAQHPVRVAGAAAAVAAWIVGVGWLGWQDQAVVDASALVGAGVLLAAALLLTTSIDREWLIVWGSAGTLVTSGAAAAVLLPDSARDLVPDARASWWVVLGLAVVAVTLGTASSRVRLPWLRDLAAAFLALGLLVALQVSDASVDGAVWTLCLTASASAVALLTLVGGRHAPAWRRPLTGLGVALTAWALLTPLSADAAAGWALLSAPLAAAALQAVASGVAYRRVQVQMLAPGFAAAAWVAFALEALEGRPTWVIAPIGMAVLVSVGLWRRDRAERGERVADPDVVWLEQVGVALLVGPSLAQAVTESLAHVAVALALGLGVAAWGVVTTVRRRVAAGVGTGLLALLLLVAVPLVQLLPSWEGAALWALIAVIGLGAVLVAAFLERGKAAARHGLTRFKEATADWE